MSVFNGLLINCTQSWRVCNHLLIKLDTKLAGLQRSFNEVGYKVGGFVTLNENNNFYSSRSFATLKKALTESKFPFKLADSKRC